MTDKASLLPLLKEKRSLYIYDSPDGRILFSILPLEEYEIIKRVAEEFPALIPDLEEDIWSKCVIEQSFGGTEADLNAGIITTLAQLVMRLSCPQDIISIESDLELARKSLDNVVKQLILKVCEAFPAYTPDEVEQMEWNDLINKVAQAEKILGKEVEFHQNNDLADDGSVPMKMKDGQEIIDFEAMNRELAES